MKGLGLTLILLGVGSFVLNLLGREFILLTWVDHWGTTVGTIIRIALIAAGAGLWAIGHKQAAGSG